MQGLIQKNDPDKAQTIDIPATDHPGIECS